MRKLFWCGLVAVGITIGGRNAEAVFMDGNDLLEMCQSSNYTRKFMCMGYIEAIYDVIKDGNKINGFPVCIPKTTNITVGQIVDIAKMFLSNHPEIRHDDAPGLVSGALFDAFPCQ